MQTQPSQYNTSWSICSSESKTDSKMSNKSSTISCSQRQNSSHCANHLHSNKLATNRNNHPKNNGSNIRYTTTSNLRRRRPE